MKPVMNETIFALATPPGRSGVAVIRVSGPQARSGLEALSGEKNVQARQAALRTLKDSVSRETLDRALVMFFGGPASYTGEDVVEYQVHGGRAVVGAVLESLARLDGHRMAEPGEFTRRAFENGKMDLTAAEAVADLINAETQAQASQALSQMGGVLAALYNGWRERLTRSLAYLEADLDFPNEDLPGGVAAQVRPELEALLDEMTAHLSDNRRGERLRDGIHVAVIGAPNAGKSSLVNALVQRDVAIVSDIAGTTRDVIEVHLDLGGYPVILADTAGLRPDQIGTEGQDSIESEGIRRALKRAEGADIRLLLFDAGEEPDHHTLSLADENAVVAFNKVDCHPEGAARLKDPESFGFAQDDILEISAQTGEGMEALLSLLQERIENLIGKREAPSLTRQRHRQALEECRNALKRSFEAEMPELLAEDVRLAIRALGRITGRVDVEDLLDVIFRDFCIGK